ncbi:hypothetical protein ACHAQH_009834 [Verticillium albo-atrum]
MAKPTDTPPKDKGPIKIEDLGPNVIKINSNAEYVRYLNSLTASQAELKKGGYVLQTLSIEDLNAKNRCQRCDARCVHKKPKAASVSVAQSVADTLPNVRVFDAAGTGSGGVKEKVTLRNKESTRVKSRADKTNEGSAQISAKSLGKQVAQNPEVMQDKPGDVDVAQFHCNWHSGEVKNKVWTCCDQHVSQPGCMHEKHHLPREFRLKDMTSRFQCFNTPRVHEYWRGPKLIRNAVAIDCEMGTAFDNECQLIRVTLIDYFTAEVLIDRLVWPEVTMAHLNTQYSGVTWPQLRQAQRDGKCIMGTAIARNEVLKYVGPQTIVVAHGGGSDLSALNWIHPLVVDSHIVEAAFQKAQKEQEETDREVAEAERQWLEGGPGPSADVEETDEKQEKKQLSSQRGKLTLKSLAQERLGRQIQMDRRGHDSLEDAMAARDIVHWHVMRLIKQAQDEAAGIL